MREVSISSDGRFWIDVCVRPKDLSSWLCNIAIYPRAPDAQCAHPVDMGPHVEQLDVLTAFPSAVAAIEYGRALGLQLASRFYDRQQNRCAFGKVRVAHHLHRRR